MKNSTRLIAFAAVLFAAVVRAEHVPPEPGFEFLFEVVATLDKPLELGTTKYGKRRIIGINGGTVTGPRINGNVVAGGADWQTIRADGTADLVAKYSFVTDDGYVVFIENSGIRTAPQAVLERLAKGEDVSPAEYYMRTSATLEVNDQSPYSDLNRSVVISTGIRRADSVVIRFYKVL